MLDSFGRSIDYLRISLTDRCNLRCAYCMPLNTRFSPAADLMTDDELLTLFRLFVSLGFRKFRLSGGEPTVHPRIVELVRAMSAVPGVGEICMTTNGLRLAELARPLASAGLNRCNISLDSLDPQTFRRIARRGAVQQVIDGIHAAEDAGLLPIKINCVVMRGWNDGQNIIELARLTLKHSWQVRFIELMPFGEMADFAQREMIDEADLRVQIERQLGELLPVAEGRLDGEARLFRLDGARGTLGFISSVSQPFCGDCSRVRLTADGRLRLCLLSDDEIDLLTPLRAGGTLEELAALIQHGIQAKPWGHRLSENIIPANRLMAQIGG